MKRLTCVLLAALAAPAAAAAVVPDPGYAVRAIPTPATATGGVVHSANAILVGQGPFGARAQRIVRLDASGATTIATDFNSLGGFDLDAAGTLYVVDNGGEQAGATTGDTLFAIPDALTRSGAVTAAGHEVVPAGTIPAAQDVLLVPGGAVLVTDAAGPGVGRVVRVTAGVASNFISGLDYAAGLALTPAGSLLVGNVDASFVGSVRRYDLAGAPQGTLVDGLSGEYAQVVDLDGNVLVSGGFAPDTTSDVIAVAPDGGVTEVARGFGFSSEMFFDAPRDEVLVLDFGVAAITAICRDRDADGVCDLCPGAAVEGVRVALDKLATPPGDDKLAFKGAMTIPAAPALDLVTTGVRLLVEDKAGPILDAAIPGGAFDKLTRTGWTAKNGAWKYQNRLGGPGGIVQVLVKASAKVPGLVKFSVQGKNGRYPFDPADLPLRAALVLDAGARQCGAVTPSECKHNPKRGTLRCK